jgi:hypothetical protein
MSPSPRATSSATPAAATTLAATRAAMARPGHVTTGTPAQSMSTAVLQWVIATDYMLPVGHQITHGGNGMGRLLALHRATPDNAAVLLEMIPF